jgi:hypothetical protein
VLAEVVQSDGGFTLGWLVKAALVIFGALVVIGIIVGVSMLIWRLFFFVFFGGIKRALLSVAALSAGLYLNVVNPIDIFRDVDQAWGENPLVAIAGIVVLAAPVAFVVSLFADDGGMLPSGSFGGGSRSARGGFGGGGGDGDAGPSSGWSSPAESSQGFDSRYGPQQGTSTPAERDPYGLYGDGPQQGFKTLSDEPGGLYSDGPQY